MADWREERSGTDGLLEPARSPGIPGLDDPGVWAVVLAGGEGVRLRPLTRCICGEPCPKQFAPLLGGRSLLRQTLDRTRLGVPWERTLVVAQEAHAGYLVEEFGACPAPSVLRQPGDRGTAAAILLAAHWISWRHPGARIAIFPADHFIRGERAFMAHVGAVVAAAAAATSRRLVLVGATPFEAEPQYGWIERGARLRHPGAVPLWRVRGFVEKPTPAAARAAWERGHLWNTFVLVGQAAALIELGERALPELTERIARLEPTTGTRAETAALAAAYATCPPANFSRAVLEGYPTELAVSRLPPSVRWSDWGTPERVITSLLAADLVPEWLLAWNRANGATLPATGPAPAVAMREAPGP